MADPFGDALSQHMAGNSDRPISETRPLVVVIRHRIRLATDGTRRPGAVPPSGSKPACRPVVTLRVREVRGHRPRAMAGPEYFSLSSIPDRNRTDVGNPDRLGAVVPEPNTFGNRLTALIPPHSSMVTETDDTAEGPPWPQQLLDSVWLLALAAILYWMLAYIVWGVIDILSVPMG